MLQIISGKFFREGEELIETSVRKVLYSNYDFVIPIQTVVAGLEPIDRGSSVSQYLLGYTSRMPANQGSPGFRIVRMGDSTVVEQFRLLAIFGLRAYFSTEREDVSRNCRKHPISGHDRLIPANYVRRYFDPQIHGDVQEVEGFQSFITKIVALPRRTYERVIACLANYSDALEVLNYNIDLAYSMLVYSLEALVADFDAFMPVWDDYKDPIKTDLDTILADLPGDTATRIRDTLLQHRQFRLQQRFIAFVAAHLREQFYTEQAAGVKGAVRSSELRRALENVYQARSNYVHNLKSIQAQMKERGIADCEVFRWQNEPYLTFSGLSRLAYEVISQFIDRQPECLREDFNWRSGLPDVVTLPMAPEYWIWRVETATAADSGIRLSAFCESLVGLFLTEKPIADMRAVLQKYEGLFSQSTREQRLNMLSAYTLWTVYFPTHPVREDAVKFIERNDQVFEDCSVVAMTTMFLTDNRWKWPAETCAATYRAYEKRRIKPTAVRLPFHLELALMLQIANAFFCEHNAAERDVWLNAARFDAAGNPELQERIQHMRSEAKEIAVFSELFPELHRETSDKSVSEPAESIRLRAYKIWEDRMAAGASGDSLSDWISAERGE